MAVYSTLAAVDLGSNSFHLQVARVVGDQLYPLDSLREPIRFGAGLNREKRLDEDSQNRALDCIRRFGERLRGFDPHAVRAVGTNTLRVAKNAAAFLKQAEAALGFPIEVVAGREEARLIYVGVAHSLPVSKDKRLVVDIGGGSTEFIIGRGLKPLQAGQPLHGVRQLQPQVFPRRRGHQERDEAGGTRRAHRTADHGRRVREGQLAARRWVRPAARARWPKFSS